MKNTCSACGGVLGRDCWNEQDCLEISRNMQYECQWENCSGGEYCEKHSLLTPSEGSGMEWEKKWAEFCAEQAKGFDRFSELQRSGIAGCYEINGKSFIEKLLASNTKEVLQKLETEITDESNNISVDDDGNEFETDPFLLLEDARDVIKKVADYYNINLDNK